MGSTEGQTIAAEGEMGSSLWTFPLESCIWAWIMVPCGPGWCRAFCSESCGTSTANQVQSHVF